MFRSNLKFAFAVILLLASSPTIATAGSVAETGNGGAVWQAGVDGVEVEWNGDGSVKRISSRFSTPVEFGDRRGISKAQIIAEEKAKASIVRFLEQSVSTTRVTTEMQNDLNQATQERQTGAKANVKKVDQRIMIESLTEVTTSFAAGKLRGVIVLEKGYDDKTEEAWVVVGISDKTIKAASGVKAMSEEQKSAAPNGADGLGKQPSEVKRSNQKDW
ncbi:hypothetical protein IVB12_06395 [Bradyrhizobium sp. 179]|uniref:hypothetical protein n=1 Tax=Bradyrhizobium sp. 179 TaxID=2782648 RepID=UPI001FF9064E|nr:hypothetical protein [Bradyrhizobium sp. 179]MCK1541618.1 hypothetical protein [Bradyrhizobium sp. 179]